MYKGNENLISDGQYLSSTIEDFWRWAYSDLIQNTNRGVFAEFLVAKAIGLNTDADRSAWTAYDLDGPVIQSTGVRSRIEVKCAAKVQTWGMKHPDNLTFSIRPAKLLTDNVGYEDDSPRQRNNDLYVFSVYNATTTDVNPLDMYWWDFYVLSTYDLECSKYRSRHTISLKSLQDLGCNPIRFCDLGDQIENVCRTLVIPSDFVPYTEK